MPSGNYRRREVLPLPPPESLPFPGNVLRSCSNCNLRKGCTAPVPGENVLSSQVMLVGEAPGFNEDQEGKPFVGQAGLYLNSLLTQAGVPKPVACITNCVRCRPPNNRTPTPAEVSACSSWLDLELGIVNPRIVVAMGATAIARFLGQGVGTVEHLHGKPVELDDRIILPAYHPAAALHNTTLLRQCQEDFRVLGGLVKGNPVSDYHAVDEYPNPCYQVADTPEKESRMWDELRNADVVAVDTEICRGKLWSVQFSTEPGTAWLLPIPEDHVGRVDLTVIPGKIVLHNYLFDVRYVNVRDDGFVDSMVMAYLTGCPQGLKELASRLCGVNMVTYSEMVRPGQLELSLKYLTEASNREWPAPPVVKETKWSNMDGCLVTRQKKPWHISRKIAKILSDMEGSAGIDPFRRWRDIPEPERAVVEGDLGPMPESSLADIPMEDAMQYGCRDADVTLRVYNRLCGIVSDLELDFVLRMDTAILPMVYDMMRNGMAVDVDHFRKLSEEYESRMEDKASELAGVVGHPFNPNSSQQVDAVVYGELGYKPTRMTPSGGISTDDQELKKTGHPVAKGVIEYRRLSKMKGTYADALVEMAVPDADGVPRIHTTLKTTRTETGRLASADPNLQNQPTRSKEGKAIRKGFVPPPGWILGEGDLGQIEMCVQAHLARCKGLIDLFLRGDDPHTVTASHIFGVPYEEAKKEKYRYPTKRANFGIIYMIGAKGLSEQIAEYISDLEMEGEPVEVEPWSEQDCEKFITDWYKLYPEVKDYQFEMASMARRYGYVRDMFRRIRYVPEVFCPVTSVQEAGCRQASNMPVQSSAQGIIKLAMGELWRELPRTEWHGMVRWLMQIHDSLVVEMVDDRKLWMPYLRWMHGIMCGVVKLLVPVKADFKVGRSWGELEKVKLEGG